MWLECLNIDLVIIKAWSEDVVGSLAFKLVNKLINTRKKLISWNKNNFGQLQQKVHELNMQIHTLQIFIVLDQLEVGKIIKESNGIHIKVSRN